MSNIIDKIKLSGTSYTLQDSSASRTVELTQAQYDALVASGAVDTNTFYIITDATPINIADYYTTAQTNNAIDAATSGKVDNSVYTAYTASTNTALGNKQDTSGMTAYTSTATTNSLSGTVTAHTADTTIHVTTAQTASWDAKSNFSGSYNDLTDKPTIPVVDASLDSGSTNPVANSAITTAINNRQVWRNGGYWGGLERVDAVTAGGRTYDLPKINRYFNDKGGTTLSETLDDFCYFARINGKKIAAKTKTDSDFLNYDLLPASAVTTSITSGSTDTEVPSAKAVNDSLSDTVKLSDLSENYINSFTNYTDRFHPNYHKFNSASTQSGTAYWLGKINDKYVITTGTTSTAPDDLMNLSVVETSAVTSSVTSASTDSQIPTAKAVFDAIPTGGTGGGKAISAGTNISVTTGETADTINCTLPISASSEGIYTTSSYPFSSTAIKTGNVVFGYYNRLDTFGSSSHSNYNAFFGSNHYISTKGDNMFIAGNSNKCGYPANTNISNIVLFGYYNKSSNPYETAFGRYNVSQYSSTSFGNSGNTLFSVGNGTADNARHNAFEIRQNGDIYLTSGGTDIKLQDHLGGGGGGITSGEVQTMIDESISGKVETSAITTSVTSSSTDAQVPSAKAVNDKLGGLSLVKLTQSAYDALSPDYDSNTLYVIVN